MASQLVDRSRKAPQRRSASSSAADTATSSWITTASPASQEAEQLDPRIWRHLPAQLLQPVVHHAVVEIFDATSTARNPASKHLKSEARSIFSLARTSRSFLKHVKQALREHQRHIETVLSPQCDERFAELLKKKRRLDASGASFLDEGRLQLQYDWDTCSKMSAKMYRVEKIMERIESDLERAIV